MLKTCGAYLKFIYAAYGVTFLILGGLILDSLFRWYQAHKNLKAFEKNLKKRTGSDET